jgi:hypothetical protein
LIIISFLNLNGEFAWISEYCFFITRLFKANFAAARISLALRKGADIVMEIAVVNLSPSSFLLLCVFELG